MRTTDYNQLCAVLGLTFSDPNLITEAFTHSSYGRNRFPVAPNYERLEFLGDAVLKLAISDYLFKKYPNDQEGRLTKLRAKIISDATLGLISESLGLGKYMRFSPGEMASGGNKKTSNLANVFEALLGAIYIDKGYKEAASFLISTLEKIHLFDRLNELGQDFKSILQEKMHSAHYPLPVYTVVKEEGPDHSRRFFVEGRVDWKTGVLTGIGEGKSKKEAEMNAARLILDALKST